MDRRLGAYLLITNRTLEEFKALIPSTAPKGPTSTYDDPFLESFRLERLSSKGLSWNGYLLRLENVETLLEKEYGVQVDKAHYKKLKGTQEVFDFIEPISHKAPMKSPEAAEHDAFHLALVRNLTDRGDGEKLRSYWFLTEDRTLPRAEKTIGDNVFCVPTEVWLETIAPFLSPTTESDVASEVFAKVLGSHLGSFSVETNDRELIRYLMPWTDNSGFDDNQWKLILSNRFIRDHLKSLRQDLDSLDDETRSTEVQELSRAMVQEVMTHNKLQSEKLEQKIDDLSAKVKSREDSLAKQSRAYKIILVAIVGILSLLVDSLIIYYLGLTIIGLGSLGIAIASELAIMFGFPILLGWINSK